MRLLPKLKTLVNQGLAVVGHRIDSDALIPQFDRLVRHLARAGLTPVTIFDVGVADGNPWIYKAYPAAKYFLIDPTPQSLPSMQCWARHLNAEVLNIALGNNEGRVRMKVRPGHAASSMFDEIGAAEILEEVEVPLRRFDKVIPKFERPALVKIDAQGAEMLVLEGMGYRLQEIDCVIVATSLIATLRNGPEFSDVVGLMRTNGFVLFDITGILRRPLDQALAQIEAVFVPESSRLRSDRRWAGS